MDNFKETGASAINKWSSFNALEQIRIALSAGKKYHHMTWWLPLPGCEPYVFSLVGCFEVSKVGLILVKCSYLGHFFAGQWPVHFQPQVTRPSRDFFPPVHAFIIVSVQSPSPRERVGKRALGGGAVPFCVH